MWYSFYKLIRPVLLVCSALAAGIVSHACGAPTRISLVAATAIALSTLGAGLYHYGGANWMYVRKSDEWKFKDPQMLMLAGLITFSLSIIVAVQWLPKQCVYILVFNTVAIAAYSVKLSAHWTTKNLTMALICATPVAIGWQAGTVTHPMVPAALFIAGIANLAREIVKDVEDIEFNHGRRVTLPMVLTHEQALQIAGGFLLVVGCFPIYLLHFTQQVWREGLIIASVVVFLATAGQLIWQQEAKKSKKVIMGGIFIVLMALI